MIINKTLQLLTFLTLLVAITLPGFAQEKFFGEDTLKALYSYKFALFTEWPKVKLNESNTAFKFCVIGNNPFGQSALEAIEGKPLKKITIHVEVYGSGVLSDESLKSCHAVYVSASEKQRLPALLGSLRQFPILTISDIPGFSSQGGMVTLIKSGDHIQFEINPNALREAELIMSSKIIELATLVKTKHEGRE